MHSTETKNMVCNEKNEDSNIKKKNPTSSRELKIICLYIKEAFEERDHPTVH